MTKGTSVTFGAIGIIVVVTICGFGWWVALTVGWLRWLAAHVSR